MKTYQSSKLILYRYLLKWGSQTQNFKKNFYYFELVRSFYQTLLMFGISFFYDDDLRNAFILLSVILYLLIIYSNNPFFR